MFSSPGRTGAGIASVLGNTGPLIVIVLAAWVLGERVTRAEAAALVLGLSGVSLVAWPAFRGDATAPLLGTALPLLAAVGSASESVLAKRMRVGDALPRVTAWQYLLGSVPLLVASGWLERGRGVAWTPTFVGLLLYLALVGSALATSAWYWLLQDEEAGRLTLYLFLVPVIGLALAAALFGERVGRLEAMGVTLTLSGIALVTYDAWRTREVVAASGDGRVVAPPLSTPGA